MASPNTLALRERMGALKPAAILAPSRAGKLTAPGEYAGLLRRSATGYNTRRRAVRVARRTRQDAARGFERTIPASGPGRRRAKAARNLEAAEATEAAHGRLSTVTAAQLPAPPMDQMLPVLHPCDWREVA